MTKKVHIHNRKVTLYSDDGRLWVSQRRLLRRIQNHLQAEFKQQSLTDKQRLLVMGLDNYAG